MQANLNAERKMCGKEKESKKDNIIFEIPAEGSLGLLALGAVGVDAWRSVRAERIKDEKKSNKDKEE